MHFQAEYAILSRVYTFRKSMNFEAGLQSWNEGERCVCFLKIKKNRSKFYYILGNLERIWCYTP
jgi:hypothetical protein